ncbi:uncharacterized protein UTRI_03661_B [Ustilago trichophora]|uniref:Uncharacterized protein n=1 Tax=Ustilago trichophora TaxID=86804 RepID=A0A5C3E1C6_9BASI|nr:uncharacterized protein UTRI_03661_B [Ustilago trichophora]
MDVSVAQVATGSPRHCGDAAAFTPDLQHSRYMSGESDDDSAHATPSDMTLAMAQTSPRESWPSTKMRVGEEEVRKIHYIDSPAQDPIDVISALSAPPAEHNTLGTAPAAAASALISTSSAPLASSQASVSLTASVAPTTMTPHSTTASAPVAASSSASISTSTLPSALAMTSAPTQMASSGLPSLSISGKAPEANADTASADPLPSRVTSTAPSSAASTPASTPGGAPQTYARKRGRPRKHPLPDPNNMPPKAKRKLSADNAATTAKKKASAAAAARSAASSAGSLLSVPDLGRLIPQGSSSENAQTFIQNNLRLFADLFVALQKQASTDHNVREEANAELKGIAEVSVDQPQPTTQQESSAPAATATTNLGHVDASSISQAEADASIEADASDATAKVSGPSDPIRDEIKKKMADVTKGREAIQAEMLQMRVDASFFENAQKAVDERILVLRERIAKNTAILQREREATRKAREASRIAKKDRKAREKGLRDSEREERRLAQTFMQLEREIAAQEEERRRLEEAESSDEEDDHAGSGEPGTLAEDQGSTRVLDQLQGFNASMLDASPSEATSMSATATPSVNHDTPAATDRAIGFSDEELAKVLGISTSELAGFSQTLEFTSLQAPSASVSSSDADPASALASILAPGPTNDPLVTDAPDATTDSFDVAAFLEMASSFGAVPPSTEQQDGD